MAGNRKEAANHEKYHLKIKKEAMYSNKKNVLQLIALLKIRGVKQIVICPGSRNIPLSQSFAADKYFTCFAVTDERSAGFFAIGLALNSGMPTAVCCTSGSALLNIHPAVAESFYQNIPLIVLSADRPAAWIGQKDGQTLPQSGVFGNLTKKSVTLPEIYSDEDLWYCNRLINEALLEIDHHGKGPIHINIPISEPFFDFSVKKLPKVRVITRYQYIDFCDKKFNNLINKLNKYQKKVIIAGQTNCNYKYEKHDAKLLCKHFVWLTEHIGNRATPCLPIKNFDAAIYALTEEQAQNMTPDLVITFGGHIVSKQLKKFLRQHRPKEHWHISPNGETADLFGVQTAVIEMDAFDFMNKISKRLNQHTSEFPHLWKSFCKSIPEPDFDFSEMAAVGELIKSLPADCVLHLANSSAIRYAQLYNINPSIEVYSNRGVNGIEGSLSTATGYAAATQKHTFIIIGDLSFFYDMNALWNVNIHTNLHILLLNNGGGEIFHALPYLELTQEANKLITATHKTSAKGWAKERGFEYLKAENQKELQTNMFYFTRQTNTNKPLLMEVFTDKEKDIVLLNEYYKKLKQK